MIRDLAVAFGTIFIAELPDKTMVATLMLATAMPRRLAVWLGVSAGYLVHVAVAVAAGSLLARLPDEPAALAHVLACLLKTREDRFQFGPERLLQVLEGRKAGGDGVAVKHATPLP